MATEATSIGIAGLSSLAFAAAGLSATAVQMGRNRNYQKENTAKAVYRDYLKLAVDNPVLADGDLTKIQASGLLDKYRWYVSYFLWACEEVIAFAPTDTEWHQDIVAQLGYHRAYLASDEFSQQELPFYSKELVEFIAKAK